jgi:hypothetical protein
MSKTHKKGKLDTNMSRRSASNVLRHMKEFIPLDGDAKFYDGLSGGLFATSCGGGGGSCGSCSCRGGSSGMNVKQRGFCR